MRLFEKIYLNRARQAAQALRWVPFLRFVGVNGSLPRGEAKESSDIDFLIVGQKGRIWTVRFFSTLSIESLGIRRKGKQVAGKICLNLYLSDDYLKLTPQTSKVAEAFAPMAALYDKNRFLSKIWKENQWMKTKTRLRAPVYEIEPISPSRYYLWLQKVLEWLLGGWFGDQVERLLGAFQKYKIENNPLTYLPGTRLVISEKELAFHPPKNRVKGEG